MSGPYRRFDTSELRTPGATEPPAAELADALGAARELEALAVSEGIRPTDGFDDRVMAAIAMEPAPRAVVSGGSAVRGSGSAAFLFAVRNAWRVGTTAGRPFAVRAQALAFVLIVGLAAVSIAGAGAIAVAGLFDRNDGPVPSLEPSPTIAPTPDVPSPSPIPSPLTTPSPAPTETAEPTKTAEPTETPDPGETPEPSDDHGGGGGSGPGGGGSDDGGGSGSDDGGGRSGPG